MKWPSAPVRDWYEDRVRPENRFQSPSRPTHNGIDIRTSDDYRNAQGPLAGEPLLSPASGVVRSMWSGGASGIALLIDHDDGTRSGFAHLLQYADGLERGFRVQPGQVVGYMGDTGAAQGVHLHFTARTGGTVRGIHDITGSVDGVRVDPLTLIPAAGSALPLVLAALVFFS